MAELDEQLIRLAGSEDVAQRLRALRLMREQLDAGGSPANFLELARSMIADPDNDCRWQALIVVGASIESNPEAVWQVICEFGSSEDDDMRTGVATVLLEHLLEFHFDTYFPKLREEIEGGRTLLAHTLTRCWPFGQADSSRWNDVRQLVERYRR